MSPQSGSHRKVFAPGCGTAVQGSPQRTCNICLHPFTRRSPTAWAWAYRSAARSSRTTEDGCGRAGLTPKVLCFSLRSQSLSRSNHDQVDVALWHKADVAPEVSDVRF